MMRMQFNRDALANLIEHIPLESRGAEIGVWHGNTSLRIVQERRPKELHLIDPWAITPYCEGSEHGTFKEYLARYEKVVGSCEPDDFQAHYDGIYAKVVKQFKRYKNVHIHRMTSGQWFNSFKGELDWVYIDGDHSFDGCFDDLIRSREVVRKGGFIFGDDYKWGKIGKPGVTFAVQSIKFTRGMELKRIGKCQYRLSV